ncbi:hypothetical protein AB6848_06120 [Serratia proteamaculans]|uniref:Uncharacterized protein n=1 Tax=Klebsiella oxytoca TaxID=571 RepID=A0A318F6U1_KLEOX|nr:MULTISPECIES: hypothetical protein [Enterobacteriaceae]EBB0508976.1 hypothetical protein [Salmonella enterica]EGC4559445.1 hypothetical protein [Escherichia coli]EKW9492737.1 hypothetical protein [Enterobacter hormaechei]HCD1870311.1 hypothetical protein [Enterobacter bugandensis]EIY3123912.1 hypothetical protein [Escherichia coli]
MMSSLSYLHNWRPELQLTVLNGTNNLRHLDFNRLLYRGVPSAKEIISGNGIFAFREEIVLTLKNRFEEALQSGSLSGPTLVNYYVEVLRYIHYCEKNDLELFTHSSAVQYCDFLYQRVLRRETKSTAYSSQRSKLNGVFSLLDKPQKWFDDVIVTSRDDIEPFEAYSQSDLKQLLPLLRALFKQTSKQFLASPDKHRIAYKNVQTMNFRWNGKYYPLCTGINKMMSAATFLLAYYTFSNSTQLYNLHRPSRTSYSSKDTWYSMPAFKRRSFKVIHVEMGKHSIDIPKYSMEFFDKLLEVSQCIDRSENALLLGICIGHKYRPLSGRTLTDFINSFLKKYFPMFDNRGRELRPQISRFRETGSQLIEYNQGDIARGDLLNNTLATRKRHYSTGNKHENQKMTQETALIRAVQAKNKSSISEARKKLDIKILTLEEYTKRLVPGLSRSAHGSHCKEPFGLKSEKFNRKAKKHKLSTGKRVACADLLKCFGCEHQVIVQSVDDIWCLLSFKESIEESLYLHLDIYHYKKNYEKTVIYIEEKILPKISKKIIQEAELKLLDIGRHPLWKAIDTVLFTAQEGSQ